MSYYQGDFYRGDFYRGDPGFFSFLGNIAKGVIGSVTGLPLGAGGKSAAAALPGAGTLAARAGSMVKGARGIVLKHPVLTGAAAAGTIGALGGRTAARMGGRAGRMAGMRRHRRMRVTNVKALRRAIRRTSGFAKLAMRTIHLVHPKKHARFGGFKRRTRKR